MNQRPGHKHRKKKPKAEEKNREEKPVPEISLAEAMRRAYTQDVVTALIRGSPGEVAEARRIARESIWAATWVAQHGESMTLMHDGTWVPTRLIHGPPDERNQLVVTKVDRENRTVTLEADKK